MPLDQQRSYKAALLLLALALVVPLALHRKAAYSTITIKLQRAGHHNLHNATDMASRPTTREQWKSALDELPSGPKIPAFYFAHGQPLLVWPDSAGPPAFSADVQAPNGPLVQFLKDFGPALLNKYKPKAIVVFSAHWETSRETLVSDYGDDEGSNPLLYDYFGFPRALYTEVKFSSRGNSALAQNVVDLFRKAGIRARTSPKTESRGQDGRGFSGPGFDHGVFVPFIHMFGPVFNDIPIIQASIDEGLDPKKEWALGKALEGLREEGVLILAGGLPVHTFREPASFSEKTARQPFKDWCNAILDAADVQDPSKRRDALYSLTKHPAFRLSNPREEHFIPIYVAAGAGEQGGSKVLAALYGAPTIAFGI